MGIILNTAAILASGLTALSIHFGANPLYAFILGAIVFYIPLKMLLPGSKKAFSQTGVVGSLGTIFAFYNLNYTLLYSVLFGVLIGYVYLYWWILFFPNLMKAR